MRSSLGMHPAASATGVNPTPAEMWIEVAVIDAATEQPVPSVTGVPGFPDATWLQVTEGLQVFIRIDNKTDAGVIVAPIIDGRPTPCTTVAPPGGRAIVGFFDPKLMGHKAIKMDAVNNHGQGVAKAKAKAKADASEGAGTIRVQLYENKTPKHEPITDAETASKQWRSAKDEYQYQDAASASADGHAKETTCLRAAKGGSVSTRPQTFSPKPFVRGEPLGVCTFYYTDEFGFAVRKIPLPKPQAAGGPLPASHPSKKERKKPYAKPAETPLKKEAKETKDDKETQPTASTGHTVIDLTDA